MPKLCSSIPAQGMTLAIHLTVLVKMQKSSQTLPFFRSHIPILGTPNDSPQSLFVSVLFFPTSVGWSHHAFSLGTLQLSWIVPLVPFLFPFNPLCTLLSDDLLRRTSDYVIQATHISWLPYAYLQIEFGPENHQYIWSLLGAPTLTAWNRTTATMTMTTSCIQPAPICLCKLNLKFVTVDMNYFYNLKLSYKEC